MSNVFDIYTVIFLVLAVFIFLRLRSVLGTRTGEERPPYDPYTRPEPAQADGGDNIVTLPPRQESAPAQPAGERWKAMIDGADAAAGVDAIVAADPNFDLPGFLQGARAAYEMIVTAFASGDTKTLRPLLSKDVYESFAALIADRERRGERVETKFVSIDKAAVRNAELRDGSAEIEVRFVSQIVNVTRGSDGTVLDGSPEKVTEVVDLWTFARELGSRDPNWKLVGTESA